MDGVLVNSEPLHYQAFVRTLAQWGKCLTYEEYKKYIGTTTAVIVTSILQTAAGRMIFAKPKK